MVGIPILRLLDPDSLAIVRPNAPGEKVRRPYHIGQVVGALNIRCMLLLSLSVLGQVTSDLVHLRLEELWFATMSGYLRGPMDIIEELRLSPRN